MAGIWKGDSHMEQMVKKPEFCVEVHTAEQHAIFHDLLTQYDRSCCFRGRYEENPDSMRAFYMTDADGTPFAAAALYEHDPWERTINLSCINHAKEINALIPAIQWITGVAILEMGVDKVCTLVAEDSQECTSLFLSSGYSYDGFLRDHLLLADGRRSDAFLISILKHEYERQHLLHCNITNNPQ